jgi:hypothetical protein
LGTIGKFFPASRESFTIHADLADQAGFTGIFPKSLEVAELGPFSARGAGIGTRRALGRSTDQ